MPASRKGRKREAQRRKARRKLKFLQAEERRLDLARRRILESALGAKWKEHYYSPSQLRTLSSKPSAPGATAGNIETRNRTVFGAYTLLREREQNTATGAISIETGRKLFESALKLQPSRLGTELKPSNGSAS